MAKFEDRPGHPAPRRRSGRRPARRVGIARHISGAQAESAQKKARRSLTVERPHDIPAPTIVNAGALTESTVRRLGFAPPERRSGGEEEMPDVPWDDLSPNEKADRLRGHLAEFANHHNARLVEILNRLDAIEARLDRISPTH